MSEGARNSDPATSTHDLTAKQKSSWTVDQDVYVPPYKPRKTYTPMPLSNSAEKSENLSLSLFASITRHHDVPYASGRRLEVRLGWNDDPRSLAWVPGRKFIPDWTIEYVARRVEDGFVRKTVKGTLGYLPVLWRLAEWI